MIIAEQFEKFCNRLEPNNLEAMNTTVSEIAKKLNFKYYNLSGDRSSHMYIVGSVGRGTAIRGVSDLDILFDLPDEVYRRFNAYTSNGQTALLQEVKNTLKERYPKTDISGDGQVVVINFTGYTVELVPGFKQSDNSFKYPDTHEGGRWKKTKPLEEIEESRKTITDTHQNYKYTSNMLRAWKNEQGFKFGGLLIDTLCHKFFSDNEHYRWVGFESYLSLIKDLFKFLKSQNVYQSYWLALGSKQEVDNCENGKFIKKANEAYDIIKNLTEESNDFNRNMKNIFGNIFEGTNREIAEASKMYAALSKTQISYNDTEEYITNYVMIDIKNYVKIDCTVTQDGFRSTLLRDMLRLKTRLKPKKQLKFEIISTNVMQPFDIYWKVKNEGDVAKERNCIRGQIVKTNLKIKNEHTDFRGEHYVECYLVKNGVCVAKDRIEVPIDNY